MNQRGGRYQRIPFRARIWHIQFCAPPSDCGINGKNTAGESGQDLVTQPGTQCEPSYSIVALDAEHAHFQFQDCDGRQKQARRRHALKSDDDIFICLAGFDFMQLGNHIRIDEMHQQ